MTFIQIYRRACRLYVGRMAQTQQLKKWDRLKGQRSLAGLVTIAQIIYMRIDGLPVRRLDTAAASVQTTSILSQNVFT